jgi:hypothetical protein
VAVRAKFGKMTREGFFVDTGSRSSLNRRLLKRRSPDAIRDSFSWIALRSIQATLLLLFSDSPTLRSECRVGEKILDTRRALLLGETQLARKPTPGGT